MTNKNAGNKGLIDRLKEPFRGGKLQRLYWDIRNIPKKCKKNRIKLEKTIKHYIGRYRRYFRLRYTMPDAYNKHKTEPLQENKVLFIEVSSPQLSDNLQLIYDALAKIGTYDLHIHTLGRRKVERLEYEANCKEMLADLATAKYAFLTDGSNIISCIDKRPETIITNVWHACGAFKKFGMSTVDTVIEGRNTYGSSREDLIRYPNYANLNFVSVSSPDIAWAYEDAMNLKEQGIVQPLGVSRTDVFFNEDYLTSSRTKLQELFPASAGKKVILYAPTYRGVLAQAKAPDEMDLDALFEAFGKDYVLVFKHHPMVKELPVIPAEYENTFIYQVTNGIDINELLAAADICITDYSSVVFEYALLNRPMIFFAYDLDHYNDWRGFYYPYEEMTPGPVCRTNEELIEAIRRADTNFDPKEIREFNEKYMSSCDGHATERLLETVMGLTL